MYTALLQEIADAPKIPVEAIRNFDEDLAITFISNTFNDQSNGYNFHLSFHFNPIENWLEATNENKKLYEPMLKEKDDMILTLQAVLENMKNSILLNL